MGEEQRSRVLHRDILLLAVLIACAIGLFFITRAVADKVKQLDHRVAGIWYREGQRQLASGEVQSAIDSFHKATANDRDNRTYVLALADALIAGNHNAEGRQVLLRLHDSNPDDAEVNLHLARVAAKTGNTEEALRYYNAALDSPLKGPHVDEQRRQIRIEMIQFLLDHHQHNQALAELFVLDADLPDKAASHVQAAELFLEAGDARRAMDDFAQAIRLDPHNAAALAGAGEAALRLGDYKKARRYLKRATEEGENSRQILHLLSIIRMASSDDPLAPRLTAQERQKRLVAGIDHSLQRLDQCGSRLAADSELKELQAEAVSMRLRSRDLAQNPGLVRSGLKLIYQIEEATNAKCGEAKDVDEALLLIGRQHGDEQ